MEDKKKESTSDRIFPSGTGSGGGWFKENKSTIIKIVVALAIVAALVNEYIL